MNPISSTQKLFNIFIKLVALAALFLILYPIYWMFRTSLIPSVSLYEWPPALFFKPTLAAYYRAFYTQKLVVRLTASIVVSFLSTFLGVMSGSMAAYAITRFEMPFVRNMPFAFLFLRMVPSIASLLPLFLLFTSFGFVDTYRGIVSVYTAGAIPLVVWMMWGYFKDLSREIEESAYIDGSGYFNTFIKIVLPITMPAVASVSILSFTGAWNEYIMATILTRTRVMTLPPAVVLLMNLTELVWDNISAGGVLLSIPVVLLCIFAQKYFVKGLSLGAVKG
jgi:multiple sugar transport system permease protein